MASRIELEHSFTQPQAQPAFRKTRRGPMRLLVMADLSGRVNRGLLESGAGLAERPLVSVDVDNLERVIFGFAPRLSLALGREPMTVVSLELRLLDDFHPDALHDRLDLFRRLRETRQRVLDPATGAEQLAQLVGDAGDGPKPTSDAAEGAGESMTGTLERLLGRGSVEPAQARVAASGDGVDLGEFIRRIIEPHVTKESSADREHLVRSVDDAIGEQMRTLLHDPAFQRLEATWRSVHGLVTSLELGEELQLRLLDVSKQELVADLAAAKGDLSASGLYRSLVERTVHTADGEPWSLIVGDFSFGATLEDIALLSALGTVASHAGGPFVAAADPTLVGCRSPEDLGEPKSWQALSPGVEQLWTHLRARPAAAWLGLALPRVMLRLPYGAGSDPIERFRFEELVGSGRHEDYLWGNPAFALASLIASSFQENGWEMEPGDRLDVDDLPAHTVTGADGPAMQPCAEIVLNDRAADAMLARGLMPVRSYKARNSVRVTRFQSLAAPGAPLAGPWSESGGAA